MEIKNSMIEPYKKCSVISNEPSAMLSLNAHEKNRDTEQFVKLFVLILAPK